MAKKEVKEESARRYTVRSPLRHDGEDYAPGETVELTPSQAAAAGDAVGKAEAAPIEEPAG